MAKPSSNQNDHSRIENRSLKSRQFKGIRMRKWGKWVSEIRMPNSRDRIWLGSYDTPEKAARAFDFAVYCLRGSKADFNFPYSLPDIPEASTLSPQQIQDAAAKFAAEEIWLPSERNIPYPSSLTPLQIQTAAAKFTGEEIWLPSEDNAVDIPTPLLHVRRKFKPPQPNSPQENSRCLPKITQCPLTTVRTVNLGLKAKRFQ